MDATRVGGGEKGALTGEKQTAFVFIIRMTLY